MYRVKLMSVLALSVIILTVVTAYGDYEGIQSLESYNQKARVLNFECKSDSGKDITVKIEVCSPNIIRIRMSPTGEFEQPVLIKHGIVKTDWPNVDFTVKDEEDFVEIETEILIVKVKKSPFRLSFLNQDGEVIAKESGAGIGYNEEGDGVVETLRLLPDEKVIYFGDTARVPYGNKSRETVTRFSKEIVKLSLFSLIEALSLNIGIYFSLPGFIAMVMGLIIRNTLEKNRSETESDKESS